MPTLPEVLSQTVARHGDKPALLSEGLCLSWRDLQAEAERLARLLWSVGVRKGDPVAFLLHKRPEIVIGFLACARIGALYTPVNFKLHSDQLRDFFRRLQVRTVLVEKSLDSVLKPLLPELSDPERILYVGERGSHGEGDASADASVLLDVTVEEHEPCYLNVTSGTTGQPKGALTTHANILAQATSAFGDEGLGFREDDVFLGMFSVFAHPHELFHRSLVCGGSFVILDSLSPRVIAQTIERFGVTWMMAVPSLYEMLLDHVGGRHDLSSLRMLESGGAYVSAGTLERMEEHLKAAFMPVWGSTETTGVALALRPDRPRRPGATGRPVQGYEIRVVDRRGRDCPAGELGELLVRGPSVVSGYLDNAEESARCFRDGWYHTADLVRVAEDGFVDFVGRVSEMLKIGGIRVYPLEIEKVIKDHPQVRDVVVVRAEERIRGEVARAVVECEAQSTLTARKLQAYCRDRMAPYKVPRIVEFWTTIPALPNGKIDKRAVVAVPVDPARDDRA